LDTRQHAVTRDLKRNRVLVIIPALNEEASIGAVLVEVRRALPSCDILVIDDGSTDRTALIASEHATVASLPFNVGVGGAMRTGFKYALARGYDVVVQIDADGQHDPFLAEELIAELEHADVVVGSRFAGLDVHNIAGPRRLAMRMLAGTVSRLVQTQITDSTSGFRAHSRQAVRVFAEHYPREYLGDTVESLVIAHKAGLRVRETPIVMRDRTHGSPSQGTISATRYVLRVFASACLAQIRSWPVTRGVPT